MVASSVLCVCSRKYSAEACREVWQGETFDKQWSECHHSPSHMGSTEGLNPFVAWIQKLYAVVMSISSWDTVFCWEGAVLEAWEASEAVSAGGHAKVLSEYIVEWTEKAHRPQRSHSKPGLAFPYLHTYLILYFCAYQRTVRFYSETYLKDSHVYNTSLSHPNSATYKGVPWSGYLDNLKSRTLKLSPGNIRIVCSGTDVTRLWGHWVKTGF